ncbi:MAG: hypothetical protein WBP45_11180 [Daejeonella sp.]
MKNFIYICFALILLASCQSNEKENKGLTSSNNEASEEKKLDVPWIVTDNEKTQKLEIKKNPAADASNLNVQDIIDALNIKYPQIKLEWVKQEGEKAFVKIIDADYLTQQMGTTGAESYLAETVFSITEIKGITSVDIKFEEGDHAEPGVYTRKSFKRFNVDLILK